ncbi:MAG: LURP-one-related/scramblase family protein [Erysipelotrichaceae bacterium]
MKYYIEQKLFTFYDKFDIYDQDGKVAYYVEGQFLSFGKQFRIYDHYDQQVGYIEQKVLTLLPQFEIYRDGQPIGTLVKELTLFKPNYYLKNSALTISGDILAHDYTINHNQTTVATITKQWLTVADKYQIAVNDDFDPVIAISVALAIDAVMSANNPQQ